MSRQPGNPDSAAGPIGLSNSPFACRWRSSNRAIKANVCSGRILHPILSARLGGPPERGFAAPIAGWLRGPMREVAAPVPDENGLPRTDFSIRGKPAKWREHLAQKSDWSAGTVHVLMFQAWREQQGIRGGQISEARTVTFPQRAHWLTEPGRAAVSGPLTMKLMTTPSFIFGSSRSAWLARREAAPLQLSRHRISSWTTRSTPMRPARAGANRP